ncbi:hypothetical protein LCGC14_0653360 [marine sediment metagenome]|uniref:Uncharacterized protein n=1 Tax=marine sediment metagenome TaxID=412755 RepID=A0A0F9R0W9_9ZZZZ
MNYEIRRQKMGYHYSCEDSDWSIETDYHNYNIYVVPPTNENDFAALKQFGIAIGRAVADMKKDIK